MSLGSNISLTHIFLPHLLSSSKPVNKEDSPKASVWDCLCCWSDVITSYLPMAMLLNMLLLLWSPQSVLCYIPCVFCTTAGSLSLELFLRGWRRTSLFCCTNGKNVWEDSGRSGVERLTHTAYALLAAGKCPVLKLRARQKTLSAGFVEVKLYTLKPCRFRCWLPSSQRSKHIKMGVDAVLWYDRM